MGHPILDSIDAKLGIPNVSELISSRLTGSELNSLLLELFDRTTAKLSAVQLMKLYQQNRLVQPASGDMIAILEQELATLKLLRNRHFTPIELSPVSQLGSCSVIGTVDQKKIVSATRNTEVLADATNAMALHIAHLKKTGRWEPAKFCTVHRHVRTQPLIEKWMTPHFKIGCLVSAGRDEGNLFFERTSLVDHIETLHTLMSSVFSIRKIRFKLQRRNDTANSNDFFVLFYQHCRRERTIITKAFNSK